MIWRLCSTTAIVDGRARPRPFFSALLEIGDGRVVLRVRHPDSLDPDIVRAPLRVRATTVTPVQRIRGVGPEPGALVTTGGVQAFRPAQRCAA